MTIALTLPRFGFLAERKDAHRTYLGRVLLLVRKDRVALLGAAMFLVPFLAAALAPVLAPYDPLTMESTQRLLGPGAPGHILGTDAQGRDILSRLLYGGRISILIALLPVFFAGVTGWLPGAVAAAAA